MKNIPPDRDLNYPETESNFRVRNSKGEKIKWVERKEKKKERGRKKEEKRKEDGVAGIGSISRVVDQDLSLIVTTFPTTEEKVQQSVSQANETPYRLTRAVTRCHGKFRLSTAILRASLLKIPRDAEIRDREESVACSAFAFHLENCR